MKFWRMILSHYHPMSVMPDSTLQICNDYTIGRFTAMANPCELLVDSIDPMIVKPLVDRAMEEAHRIENKFSRYRLDNIVYRITNANGATVRVDEETANLLDYASECYQISDGLFDITSGVLRKIWTFDGSDRLATQREVDDQLKFVGWNKIRWERPDISLLPGMELDFGGIGKEYAVDQVYHLLVEQTDLSCLINFGGDIRSTSMRASGSPWMIGIEDPRHLNNFHTHAPRIQLSVGAIATSGDSRKYLMKNGIRYSHVINPKTGWPTFGGPRSITVAASTCTEAGILATLAILQGSYAEEFLKKEQITYWCEW